jgi:prepilin-type N-terminal cleavage/methylation domain-containing protein
MHKVKSNANQKGFSILEVLVAMVIFLVVTGSIYGLLQIGRIDRNRSSRRSDVLKNARVAVQLIGRDALNAGLGYNRIGALTNDDFLSTTFGIDPDDDDERDFITSVIPGDDLNPNNLGTNQTDFIAFCARDMDYNGGDLLNLQSVSNVGTTPVVRTQLSNGATAAGVEEHHLYLIESDTGQTAVMVTADPTVGDRISAAPTDPLGINQPYGVAGQGGTVLRPCASTSDTNCTTYVATLKRFSITSYHVDPDGSLIRRTYGNNTTGVVPADQIQQQVLAYNVQDLQIEYVLADGTVTNSPTIASPGPDNDWDTEANNVADQANLIRQINISITVLATERDEQTTNADSITLRATFSTRNMEYTAG